MEEAAFKLDTYKFTKVSLNLDIQPNATLVIEFYPSGCFSQETGVYELNFDTIVTCEETNTKVVCISCVAKFSFKDAIKGEDIPEHFYPNSLAIIFPYIRAFVSTVSLQANVRPIILPTVNLIGLTNELRQKTKVINNTK
ncbi:protein-export chaperone SecB [uncultured Prevotella sp.]|uniref:protein-export chaperone SecB n=1 Tax=uncultured Prevotella sp. TaxID=159272 RepID=UPI0025F6034A|nr:protein-export chaperone SecB [uncultured Prevotella sp.]